MSPQFWTFLPVVALAASAVLARVSPVVGERCRPGTAGPVLAISAFLCSGCLLTSLAMFAAAGFGRWHVLAGEIWSQQSVAQDSFLPAWTAVPALLVLVVLTVRTVRVAAPALRSMARVQRAARHSAIVVTADRSAPAYAIGGLTRGQIVLCSELLADLGSEERVAVLAHEQEHLRGRHHWLRALATTAAAGNPLLHRVPATVALTNELAADQAAVSAVGSGTPVARAIARLGLRSAAAPGAAFGELAVATRIRVLADRPGYRRWPVVVVVAALTCMVIGSAIALDNIQDLFEVAWLAEKAD